MDVLLVVLVLAGVLSAYSGVRHYRKLACVEAIERRGGAVILPPPLIDNLRNLASYGVWRSETWVMLIGKDFDRRWLLDQKYLTDISITHLEVFDVEPIETVRLIEAHPIKSLSAGECKYGDALASALSHVTQLSEFHMNGGNLTDTGLGDLPLETLKVLDVNSTKVTADGLEKLKRCGRLEHLILDGDQFNESVARRLASLPTLKEIELLGGGVTDQHLRWLGQVEGLSQVVLYEPSVTPAGVNELSRSIPNCTIVIDD